MRRKQKLSEDLDRKLDELLADTSLAFVIAETGVSAELKGLAKTEPFQRTTAAVAFEAFDRGQVPRLPGLTMLQFGELERALDDFAMRVRLADIADSRLGSRLYQARGQASAPAVASVVVTPTQDAATPPDEVLGRTTLREIIVTTAGGIPLLKRLRRTVRSPLLDTMAGDFLSDDEGETRYSEILDTRGYLVLVELVNAFAADLFRQFQPAR